MIAILNLGSGNIGSLVNALNWIGVKNMVIDSPSALSKADKIIFPGVGSFDTAMRQIDMLGLREPLSELVLENKAPTLGICLGMQILTGSSEEGSLSGLNWIAGKCVKLIPSKRIKVPNMGWLRVHENRHTLLNHNIPDGSYFYFAHSYKVGVVNTVDTMMTSHLAEEFSSGINSENIFGIQFHPEKSHDQGLQLLKNFAEL